jgi:hypothetical protein
VKEARIWTEPPETGRRVFGPDALRILRYAGYDVAEMEGTGFTTVLRHPRARAVGRLYERLRDLEFHGEPRIVHAVTAHALEAARLDQTVLDAADAAYLLAGNVGMLVALGWKIPDRGLVQERAGHGP